MSRGRMSCCPACSAGPARVLETLRSAARDQGRAVLLVTHEEGAAAYADRVFRMNAGTLEPEA